MEWILIITLQWASQGTSMATTNLIEGFKTEALCKQAAQDTIKTLEFAGPGGRTLAARTACIKRQ
jgi:hypothetical protein